jgi:hypothetical protein
VLWVVLVLTSTSLWSLPSFKVNHVVVSPHRTLNRITSNYLHSLQNKISSPFHAPSPQTQLCSLLLFTVLHAWLPPAHESC